MKLKLRAGFAGMIAYLALLPSAQATTFSFGKMDDPFSYGVCEKNEIVSYGSYIYRWDSKYDGIYWPVTDSYWLWGCPDSGFVAYPSDFENISDEERILIEAYLKEIYTPSGGEMTFREKRTLIEGLYHVRGMGDEFWVWFYRVLAYWADTLDGDQEKALEYRAKALALIVKELEGFLSDDDKIKNLFLAGEYSRQMGNEDQMHFYFSQAKNFKWTDEEGDEQIGIPYYNELIQEGEELGLGVLRTTESEDWS
ncbi:MAG: hypothetical protein IH995_04290 [Proteobacteria bacterium]|nr:hypothetical protein [Pseudomonadota bacterium]